MYHYQLNMVGLTWDILSPIELPPDETCKPFLTHDECYDIQLTFELGCPNITGLPIWERAPIVYQDENGFFVQRTLAVKTIPSTCIYLSKNWSSKIYGWIDPDRKNDIRSIESLLDVSELEILLSYFGAVSLHSSFIRKNGQAVLFTAPSGTGKSTQADLWREYRKAEIINGDRSMIRKLDSGWTAFGSPFAGSSSIYKNESVPIGAIVILRQAPYNEIRRLKASEAFRYLYSEMVVSKWHSEAHKKIITITEQLAREVPILLLQCLPDQSAVDLLDNYMNREI